MKALQNTSVKHWMLLVLFASLTQIAMAAGFEAEAKSMMESVRDGIYVVVGVVATICLLWQMAQGFMGRKTWGDILESCLWILGEGGAIALATWIFTKGGSLSF